MILAWPCKPLGLNQPFGTNPEIYKRYDINGHNGLDFFAPDGTEVRVSHDGFVRDVGYDGDGGLGVVVHGCDGNGYYKTLYWHLKEGSPVVTVGQYVEQGDLLGLADNTGYSTGSHLHFGLKRLDVDKNTVNMDNGFKGAIDPLPFFNGDYAVDIYKLRTAKSLLERVVDLYKALIKIRK